MDNEITADIIQSHGLSSAEYDTILAIMTRAPNLVELGIFSVMWSEHCSYKSSRHWLKTLPTTGERVICGPGENAGVIDIDDDDACIFKIESHNHPSFIEPYEGAATGVGGILRDVFTMGARPIAAMNALRFGAISHPKTRYLLSGVVGGIAGYGNSFGVPTVGGECEFDPAYNGNILVNAMAVGLAKKDKIFYSAAAGIGNAVVYVGSKTGRDGIHGATMASAEFGDDVNESRPTVQVGDPFTEKLLLEACLELMQTDAIIAIQDMGAAGLTSSSVEMADKGGVGIRLDLHKVPMREDGMTPYELMLSESQERMLMVLKPGCEDEAAKIFKKWQLDFEVIGEVTDSKNLELYWHDDEVANIPVGPLVNESPLYQRPFNNIPLPNKMAFSDVKAEDPIKILSELMGGENFASRRWIWEQYDYLIRGETLRGPGESDAAIVAIENTNKALAITCDTTPRYCLQHPKSGGMQAVVEAWRNLIASGATPIAITNNLNFGNPEKPDIMGQLVGVVEGMGEACRALSFPVISGNVSLYNETNNQAILPTPVIGGVGLLRDKSKNMGIQVKKAGLDIIVVGETKGELGASRYQQHVMGEIKGAPPSVDLEMEKKNGQVVLSLIENGYIDACHDVSDGGIIVALAEICMASNLGADIKLASSLPAFAYLFCEGQARYILVTKNKELVVKILDDSGVFNENIGVMQGDYLNIHNCGRIAIDRLKKLSDNWLPDYMNGKKQNS